jgi:DNA topoisomerase I
MGGLVIVESPNKCEKIRKILGPGYEVSSSVGHIMDLDKKKLGIDIETWTPHYVISKDKTDVVKKIKEIAKKHDNIYIATDGDYEGHCISFNIKDILPKNKNIYRVLFKTITKPDVLSGIQNPIPFDELAYQAQQARRMTDRIVGFKISPQMWQKGLKGTSAGRVQSSALKFIVDREREIIAFKEKEYWTITANTELGFDAEFYGVNGKKHVPETKQEVESILKDFTAELKILEYQKKSRNRSPFPPFITSTLQKDAGTKFNWSSQKVMDVAQQLFAMGQITYMRTDSTHTEPGKLSELRDYLEKSYGKSYLSLKPIFYSHSNSQANAHECIRPTNEPVPMTLSGDELKLLDLIKARFMASQMADAKFDQVAVKLEIQGKQNVYEFRATGSVLQFDGFLKVYGASTKDVLLPNLTVGQKIKVKKYLPIQHFTKPPARYTEPAFTEKMEKDGIGRPATYAATIETLLKRNYVIRENKSLKPTEIGMIVCEYLENYFSNLTSPTFTAQMEADVDDIAAGKLTLAPTLQKFYDELLDTIKNAQMDKNTKLFKTEHDCPSCKNGSKMIKKISDTGVFLGCENHPTCGEIFIISDGKFVRNKTETGHPCPDCNSKLVEKESKWGKYLACSGYPNCKWTGKLDSDGNVITKKKAEVTDITCDKCKKGKMVKRQGANGEFLGCQNYPKCKNTMNVDGKENSKPTTTKKKCPKCKKSNLVEKQRKSDGKSFIACSGWPGCKYIEKGG